MLYSTVYSVILKIVAVASRVVAAQAAAAQVVVQAQLNLARLVQNQAQRLIPRLRKHLLV